MENLENLEKEDEVLQLAAETENTESAAAEPAADAPAQDDDAALRTENRKVFDLGADGAGAVYYAEPVHMRDPETEQYEAIDNELIEEEDGKYFRNKRNRFTARFNREPENEELFSVKKGPYKITLSAKRSARLRGCGLLCFRKEQDLETVAFANAADCADFEYRVESNSVKENIVIREKRSAYRYSFYVDTENLTTDFSAEERALSFASGETGAEIFRIPAPFMTDAGGAYSEGVFYEVRTEDSGRTVLSVIADSEWINDAARVFPVTIDPQVIVSGSSQITTYGWVNGTMSTGATHRIGTAAGSACEYRRMYLRLNMPEAIRSMRIKKAELTFRQQSGNTSLAVCPRIGLYKVTGNIAAGNCTPAFDELPLDYEMMRSGSTEYTFDVTALVDEQNRTGASRFGLLLKLTDESCQGAADMVWYGGTSSAAYVPKLTVSYESSFGTGMSSRTTSHSLGYFGTGSVDLQSGSLAFESDDFVWSGSRMPVTIKHSYTSALAGLNYTANASAGLNTADFSAMRIGKGWKLNYMQSLLPKTFRHEGVSCSGYVYITETGEEIYLRKGTSNDLKKCCTIGGQCCDYYLYTDVKDSDCKYDPCEKKLYRGSETYAFDSAGRLTEITDEAGNHTVLTYTSGKLTSVTDGAGRVFSLNYTAAGQLTSIVAPDETCVSYAYEDGYLTQITYPDGRKAQIGYLTAASGQAGSVRLLSADDTLLYAVSYFPDESNRVFSIIEYAPDGTPGQSQYFEYAAAARKTTVTAQERPDAGESCGNSIKTIYTFDEEGNVVSSYLSADGIGNAGAGEETPGSGINPYLEHGAAVACNISNLLFNHDFSEPKRWSGTAVNAEDFTAAPYYSQAAALFGGYVMRLQSHHEESLRNGFYQTTNVLPAGQYTFSAYLRLLTNAAGAENVPNPGAYLAVSKTDGILLTESEHIKAAENEYVRLVVSFELKEAQAVRAGIYVDGRTTLYVNAPQLEKNASANAYNMLTDGGFEDSRTDLYWSGTANASQTAEARFDLNRSLKIVSNPYTEGRISQSVQVKSYTNYRETFTLSGWAKGTAVPARDRQTPQEAVFRLKAEIRYSDNTAESHTADFSPCTEEWQLASVQFTKEKYKTVSKILVSCEYSYNTGCAYFDCIQLVRSGLETGLSADDFTVISESGGEEELGESAETDAAEFREAKDGYGNSLTETTFMDGEFGTLYKSFAYNASGNDLTEETDARGNVTTYTVEETTSRTESTLDRCGVKTETLYDTAGRLRQRKISKNASLLGAAEYGYDALDNLTGITRGDGMGYALQYDAFRNPERIGVNGIETPLVKYTYKDGGGRLKQVEYANGDKMNVIYNSLGQVTAETWTDRNGTENAKYRYLYDGSGNIVSSVDILRAKAYTYYYENGNVSRMTESDVTLNADGGILSKTVRGTVLYAYDAEGRLRSKAVRDASGTGSTYRYEHTEDGGTVATLPTGVKSHGKTDHLGRKTFDELQLGKGFLSRQFTYHPGSVTQTHIDNGIMKSSPATGLIQTVTFANGRTITYGYDAEERITRVEDSADGVTEYAYDGLGQLASETRGSTVTTVTYDNYGNIRTKGGNTYTYGNRNWKDLLTAYNGTPITYDAGGNPLSYRGFTFTWEKGRQLKSASFDGSTAAYAYNAGGQRTSKTVNGVKHEYLLEGAKILREKFEGYDIEYLYDHEDTVCGMVCNGRPYYYYKNLQGDVIAVTDSTGAVMLRYTYDAWGKPTGQYLGESEAGGIDFIYAGLNPFRYRGYYYDSETGLYWLQSRYYDPEIGRFINADVPEMMLLQLGNVLSTNLFTYCNNNPVNYADPNGTFRISVTAAGIIINVVLIALIYVTTAYNAVRLASWAKKIKWFKSIYTKAVDGLAKAIFNAMDGILYKIMGKAANAATRSFTVSKIKNIIDGLISLSPGMLIATLIDMVDHDGRNGSIYFR